MGMGGGSSSLAPLNASGVDFSNSTQAMDFLGAMLDDTVLQVDGNAFARYFWYGMAVVIGIAAIHNAAWRAILKMRQAPPITILFVQRTDSLSRVRAAAAHRPRPATPENMFSKSLATVTAIIREVSYPQVTPVRQSFWWRVPPLGTILVLLAYLAFILALEFINNDIPGGQHYIALGIRAGWLAVAQVPLLVLLAGKNNLIGLVTGVSYERLNIFHRWVARGLLLLATLHFGYQSYGWNKYGLTQMEWSTDTCPPTGMAAYAILLWLNLSTLAPFRNLSYEFFVIQHIITFFGFIIAIMIHLPSTALYSRVYIYIPIALYLVDRIVRSVCWGSNNIRPGRATVYSLQGDVTKVTIKNSRVKRWTPGTHVLLAIPKFGFAQSHPATIASTPASHNGDLVFILRSHRGFTKRICLPITKEEAGSSRATYTAFLDGPYGGSQADFGAFDTALLVAGSTGVTFTLSILLDLAHRATVQKLPLRRLEFVWMVKSSTCKSWVSDELQAAFDKLHTAGIETKIRIFTTCDERLTDAETDDQKACGCDCDKSLGPCCCVSPVDDSEDEDESGSSSKGQKMTTTTTKEKARECASMESGRPNFHDMLWDLLDEAHGETGVAVCGPLGLSTALRSTVTSISDQRAVHKGSGAQGIYLHVEGFCW